jgi:hypothetical protein
MSVHYLVKVACRRRKPSFLSSGRSFPPRALIDLAQWIFEFRITIAKQTLSREMRAMGYRKLSARPRHHAQAVGAIEDFKKNFAARMDEVAHEKVVDVETIEIWFQDEARI